MMCVRPLSFLFFICVLSIMAFAPQAALAGIFDAIDDLLDLEDAETLGWVIDNFANSLSSIPGLLAVISYIAGLVLGVRALFKIIAHIKDPRDTKFADPIKSAVASAAFLSLPYITSALIATITGGSSQTFDNTFFGGNPSTGGLDAVLWNFMDDIWDPVHNLVAAFAYIAAIILTMKALMRILKGEQEAAKGPLGFGTIGTLFVAGILFSLDYVMGAISASFFGDSTIETGAFMMYLTGVDASIVNSITAVMSAALAFFWLIGLVSFTRGWFILRGVADGENQASFMAACTHIIGGALAVNLGPLLNAVQASLGIWEMGIVFT